MQPSTIAILFIIFGVAVLILGLVVPRLDQKQSMSYQNGSELHCRMTCNCDPFSGDSIYFDQKSGKCMCKNYSKGTFSPCCSTPLCS